MSTEKDKAVETTTTEKETTTKAERRQDAVVKTAKADGPDLSNMFHRSSKSDGPSNPERVQVVKQQIDEFVNNCGNGKGIGRDVRMGFLALVNGIRNLCTLQGEDLNECFTYLYKAIKSNKDGAFTKPMLYRYLNQIQGDTERNNFVKYMNLMVKYASLDNPAAIHDSVDVNYSLSFIKNQDVQRQMLAQFAK